MQVYLKNKASMRVLEKSGFHLEAILQQVIKVFCHGLPYMDKTNAA